MTTILLITLAGPVQIPWDRFIDAVAHAESGSNHNAVGPKGERGAWQMSEAAWQDASKLRHQRKAPTGPHVAAHSPAVGRQYADTYARHLCAQLAARMGRPPTCQDLYAAWNLGLDGFACRLYDTRKVPTVTAGGIKRMEEFLRRAAAPSPLSSP